MFGLQSGSLTPSEHHHRNIKKRLESNEKEMNRNLGNQKANATLKTKIENN